MIKQHIMYLPAKQSGMLVPDDLDHYDKNTFPHWNLLVECGQCCMQMKDHQAVADLTKKACIVASIPEETILNGEITCYDLLNGKLAQFN